MISRDSSRLIEKSTLLNLCALDMYDRSCVRSAMLYGSETWCLRENEIEILRRTERAMVRAMCGAKLMKKKRTEDLMEMLGLKETVVHVAKVNGVRWYGHVLSHALVAEWIDS